MFVSKNQILLTFDRINGLLTDYTCIAHYHSSSVFDEINRFINHIDLSIQNGKFRFIHSFTTCTHAALSMSILCLTLKTHHLRKRAEMKCQLTCR